MMSEAKKRVPKRRFKEFLNAGDWEQRKLGELIDSLYNGQTPSRFDKANWEGDIPWLTSGELNRGVVNHSIEKITQQGRDDANLKIVPKGTVVIAITGLEAAGTRGNCAKLGFDTTLNQSCMAIYPKSEFLDPDFLFQWYIAVGEEYGIKYTQGTKQQSYNAELIKILPISVPRVTEQRKITRILDSFDDIITLHQRKIDKLQATKKALLQEMFPEEGQDKPKRRFKGCTDAWEQRKLSDISTKVTTKNVDVHYTETLTNSAEQGIISQVDFFDKEITNKDNINGYYIVENNDFIYNPRISTLAPVGPINRNKLNRTGIMSPLYTVFRASNVDLDFLEWYFQSSHWHRYMKLNGDSGARADRIAIKDSTFFDMPIKTPVNIKEQVLIGETLEKFNQYITLHQRKLDKLKNLKQAYLNEMFV